MKERMSNLELLRIMAMLMIIALHYMGHGGALENTEHFKLNFIFSNIIESFSIFAVNVYVIISGYFLVESNLNYAKIIKVWLQVFFYSILVYIILVILKVIPFSTKLLMQCLFPLLTNQYWFASAYITLLLIVPFLNFMINALNKIQYRRLLIVSFVFNSLSFGLPINKVITPGGNSLINFIFIYCIAAYIKKYGFFKLNKYIYLIGYICSALIIFLGRMFNYILNLRYADKLLEYNFIFVVLGSICLFLFMKEINIKSVVVNRISKLTFGIYLIHDNNYIRSILYSSILKTQNYYKSTMFIPESILSIIMVFIVCSIIEYIRQYIFKLLMVDNLIDKINFTKVLFLNRNMDSQILDINR